MKGIRRMMVRASTGALVALAFSAAAANACGKDNMTMQDQEFLKAVTKGDASIVREALQKNRALVHAADSNGVSAILVACYYRQKDVLAELLASGEPLNLFESAAVGKSDRLRELLKENKSLVNTYSPDGFTALGLAAFFGHADAVALLLDSGAEVNTGARNAMKVMPLHSAAAARRTDIAKLLIERGALVNVKQQADFTPLHEAAASGQLELVKLLLDYGADINARSTEKKSPLTLAEERQQKQVAQLLRQRGAER